MYISDKASAARQREAQRARDNRSEIVRALNQEQISRRDLFRWGIFTATGALAYKNGLSPFAPSAFAAVPTGTPRSPLYNVAKFSAKLPRLNLQAPNPLTRTPEGHAAFPSDLRELPARRLSYHTDFTADPTNADFINPLTHRGPIEGRPPGELFAHQRWDEFFPKVGYVMSIGQCDSSVRFHERFPGQDKNSVWCYGSGRNRKHLMPAFLIKARYGEPVLTRIYNDMPVERSENNGFGRNETQLHFHNAHNGAESDGAANVHHFPGTFYDYRWSTTLARRDKINTAGTERFASGPDGNGGLVKVAGDWRELQGTMWAHDHRFFFTAENVYKGNVGMINYYSGRDRGNEELSDGVNLQLPSGKLLDWGNQDFDVNLVVSDMACDAGGQLFFDIFDVGGFVGDIPLVNQTYAPFMEVLPRKYRFRILNASMSRIWKIALVDGTGKAVPVQMIANDGNFLVHPAMLNSLPRQGMAERYDIVVDFSKFGVGERLRFVNQMLHADGRHAKEELSLASALRGDTKDPVVGPFMEFRIVGSVASIDVPGVVLKASDQDRSQVSTTLTEQVPVVTPVRTRTVEFGSGIGDSRNASGQCTPDCQEAIPFGWIVKVNGESTHSFNTNRVSMLVPKPGEVEHWTYVNRGGGWDHPIHLHFEEGVTIKRTGPYALGAWDNLARKDVWLLGENGSVTFQVQFGEYGGSYVNHCHNTVHEDSAMLARIQLLNGVAGSPQNGITWTPNPTPDGVFFTKPEVLPEGVPRGVTPTFSPPTTGSSGTSASIATGANPT